MILLYLDESGAPADASQEYFVLAGLSVYERQVYWIADRADSIARTIDPTASESVELHGNPMNKGSGRWRRYDKPARRGFMKSVLEAPWTPQSNFCTRIFATAAHKRSLAGQDPVEYAFEQLCNRFDRFLHRLHLQGNTHRGLIILDKSKAEIRLQTLAREFRERGHRWGVLRNMADVPMFVDSRATRLIQIADLISYAVFQYYERQDDELFNCLAGRFDTDGPALHGLHHYHPGVEATCNCPACVNRRQR